jgi:hypothetical protein
MHFKVIHQFCIARFTDIRFALRSFNNKLLLIYVVELKCKVIKKE